MTTQKNSKLPNWTHIHLSTHEATRIDIRTEDFFYQ